VIVDGLNMSSLDPDMAQPPSDRTYCGGPTIDNDIVTAMPEVILRREKMARVPLIIGTTTDDLSVLPRLRSEDPLSYFGDEAGKARAIYNPQGALDPKQIARATGADLAMHEPARFVAKQMSKAGTPVWLYRFGYVAEFMRSTQSGAAHASELPFLFNSLDARYGERVTERDRTLAAEFSSYFVDFVKSGDPNDHVLPTWPQFDPGSSQLMIFTNDGPVAQRDPWKDRLDLVEQFADRRHGVR
jgi:para-nitrobenzyl esterase